MYKVSKYNVFLKNCVYNCLSTAIIQLDDELSAQLQEQRISDIKPEYLDELVKHGIIVLDGYDETKAYLDFWEKTKQKKAAEVFDLTIVTTYACNLNCTYCMQGRKSETEPIYNETKIMKDETICAILHFIKRTLEKRKFIKELHISFFGGEPLVGFKVCQKIAKGATDIAKEFNLNTSFSMTTNLTLLTDKVVDFIKKYQVYVQVTLDGNKQLHDLSRIHPNGQGTYNKIVENLEKLCQNGLKHLIIIRINADTKMKEENMLSVLKTAKELGETVYFGILEHYDECNDSYKTAMETDNELADFIRQVGYASFQQGVPIHQCFGKKAPCAMVIPYKLTIDPYNRVYNCDMVLNQKEFSAGVLSNDGSIAFSEEYQKQLEWSPKNSQKCCDCQLLPLCGGGCPALKAKTTHNTCGYNCRTSKEELLAHLQNWLDFGSAK